MPGADTLHIGAVTRRFGGRDVLGPVSFTATPGEVVAVLAPSGTGKTTLLRIALGLDHGFGGEVRRPAGPLGVMFQEPRLLPWLDVAANLRLVAPTLDASAIARLLADMGVAGTQALRPAQLSLGMARRVALARALAVRPALLVLDEPFASLDPASSLALAGQVAQAVRAKLGPGGAGIALVATHDLEAARRMATRLLVLQGAPARLVADVPAEAADAVAAQFAFLHGR